MNFSPTLKKHDSIQNLQYKANSLGKKIINCTQSGERRIDLCYIHQHLSSNKLHNVVCSSRHPTIEENFRPYNINKQKKVKKIPRIILSNSNEKIYPNRVRKNFKQNYIINNNEMEKKYAHEKVVDYTVNCLHNKNEKLENNNKNNYQLKEYKKEIKTDFSNFLYHYNKTLKLLDNIKEENTPNKIYDKKHEILCYNCLNKNSNTQQSQKNIFELEENGSQNKEIKKNINKNYIKRKVAQVEEIYKPNQHIEVPKLLGIEEVNPSIEVMENDKQEEDDYVWRDESISEMYYNNQVIQTPQEEKSKTLNKYNGDDDDNDNSNINDNISNKEDNIFSKRTSAGISTIRDMEYLPKSEENNLYDNDKMTNPNVDRSFSEYIETPQQYSSPIQKKYIKNSLSNNSSFKSDTNVKSINVEGNNLKKWSNFDLKNGEILDTFSSSTLKDNISNKYDKNINSYSMANNKNHLDISYQSQNDVINYDKQLHKSNYKLNNKTNQKMPLSSNNDIISRYSFLSNNDNRQDFLEKDNNLKQDTISSLSNNSYNNILSKNNIIQRDTPSLSIKSSQHLQQTNNNINLISSKNDISELDSLRSSLNTFNGDELIGNNIITSDKKNSFNPNNNLSKIINNVNSLSSLSSLTSQSIPQTSNIDTLSSKSKINISLKKANDKEEIIEKNKSSPSKNQHYPTYLNEMINEEPKTVNSTSSSSNNLSLLKKENSNKNDGKNKNKMTIYQTFQESGNSQFIANFNDSKRNSKEENATDVIETLNIRSKSISSTNDNINLSNTKSLHNKEDNISLKGLIKNDNNKMDENDIVNYKLNLILNDKNMDENLNLDNENLFFDISSITESGNSIKNNKSDEINKSEKLFKENNINEKDINLEEKNLSKNLNEDDLTISSLSYKNENIKKDENILFSSSSETTITSSTSETTTKSSKSSLSTKSTNKNKELSNKSLNKLSKKSSSSISTLLSEKSSLGDGSSLLSSLPTSAT